jgi:hypothetical protein
VGVKNVVTTIEREVVLVRDSSIEISIIAR